MPDSTRGSIYISTADEIGETLVDKLGGSGYTPNEWDKSINLCGISDADIPTALENIENSADGTERGSFEITKANAIASVLNKKFKTTRGFKPKEWASAVDKLTALQVKNASGAIASFKDGADDVPIASASFGIVPYQNLNGYSKPWASGCGNNKLNPEKTSAISGAYGLTVTFNNGTVNIKGTSTSSGASVYFNILSYEDFSLSNLGYFVQLFNGRGTGSFKSIYGFRTATEKTIAIGFDFSQNQNIDYTFEVSVSPVTLSSYEPYSNVCPITPYSQMNITHARKNFIPTLQWFQAGYTYTHRGVTFTVQNDGGIRIQGKSESSSDMEMTALSQQALYVPKNTIYTLSASGIVNNVKLITSGAGNNGFPYKEVSTSAPAQSGAVTDATKPFNYLLIRVTETVNELDIVIYPQLEVGSTATDYSPFVSPEVIGDNFGRSVYGGSRASDGTLTETMESITFNGSDSENWSAGTVGTYRRTFMSTALKLTTCLDNIKCDRIEPSNTSENVNRDMTCRSTSYSSNRFYVFVPLTFTEITDLTSFKTWLSNNPVQVCYPPTTPTEYALDPLPEINSYYGDNNIYTDIIDGESSVNYRADIDLSQQ
ncbi:MAG: hypothetical protein VZR54_07145 [Ruminococcus sp.]|nr:hypothetical protein [Ruminococcus sp.]